MPDLGSALGRLPRIATLLTVALFGALLVSAAAFSASRQRVFYNQITLFQDMLINAPKSYRSYWGYGELLAKAGNASDAEATLRRALFFWPKDPRVYATLGDLYRNRGLCRPAIGEYRKGLALAPGRQEIRGPLVVCLLYEGEYANASALARGGVAVGLDAPKFVYLKRLADSALTVLAPPHAVKVALR